MPPLTSDRRSN